MAVNYGREERRFLGSIRFCVCILGCYLVISSVIYRDAQLSLSYERGYADTFFSIRSKEIVKRVC